MGIFDAFKKNKKETKPGEPKAELKRTSVVVADGRLVETSKKVEAKPKKAKVKKEDTGEAYRVLLHPLITEKASWLSAQNQYVFAVAPQTNKIEIRKAINKVYGVNPLKVTVMNIAGKKIRYGRSTGVTKNWKKAVITLAPGEKIAIQEGL